jgi:hypothetical protein
MPTRRQYPGAAVQTTITSSLDATTTTIDIAATTGWPSGATAYFVVISPGTTSEEKCLATRASSTLTLTRGQDGTTGQSHSSGAVIYPVLTATDADEANELASVMTTKGDLISRSSSVPTRLAVGSDGMFLTANSAETSGLEWVRNPRSVLAWQSGQYYRTPGVLGVTEAAVQDRMYLYPLFTPTDITLDRIQIMSGNLSATGSVRLGLYTESGGNPSSLILDAGTVSVASGTDNIVEVTISQAVTAGLFFVAAVLQTSLVTKTFRTLSAVATTSQNHYLTRVSNGAAAFLFDSTTGFYQNSVSGALPSTATVDGYTDFDLRGSILPRVRVA